MIQSPQDARADVSPDHEERIKEFLARHGGAGAGPPRRGESAGGTRGWFEVPAADGYALRCEWSRMGSEEHMAFSEIAPSGARTQGAP
jgi:hypothetical protein